MILIDINDIKYNTYKFSYIHILKILKIKLRVEKILQYKFLFSIELGIFTRITNKIFIFHGDYYKPGARTEQDGGGGSRTAGGSSRKQKGAGGSRTDEEGAGRKRTEQEEARRVRREQEGRGRSSRKQKGGVGSRREMD